MPFFVLLLRPKFKKFELIQFQKAPENPSVEKVWEQTAKSIQNPEFKEQQHVGFYCPRTKKQILLPKGAASSASTAAESEEEEQVKQKQQQQQQQQQQEKQSNVNVSNNGDSNDTNAASEQSEETKEENDFGKGEENLTPPTTTTNNESITEQHNNQETATTTTTTNESTTSSNVSVCGSPDNQKAEEEEKIKRGSTTPSTVATSSDESTTDDDDSNKSSTNADLNPEQQQQQQQDPIQKEEVPDAVEATQSSNTNSDCVQQEVEATNEITEKDTSTEQAPTAAAAEFAESSSPNNDVNIDMEQEKVSREQEDKEESTEKAIPTDPSSAAETSLEPSPSSDTNTNLEEERNPPGEAAKEEAVESSNDATTPDKEEKEGSADNNNNNNDPCVFTFKTELNKEVSKEGGGVEKAVGQPSSTAVANSTEDVNGGFEAATSSLQQAATVGEQTSQLSNTNSSGTEQDEKENKEEITTDGSSNNNKDNQAQDTGDGTSKITTSTDGQAEEKKEVSNGNKGHDTTNKNNDSIVEPAAAESHPSDDNVQEEEENPFEGTGPILVAIPQGYTLREVAKLSKLILNSPSFAILTVGNSIEQVENTTTEQELAQLKSKGVTKVVSEHLTNKVSLSKTSTQIYQEQDKDLEHRRKKRNSFKAAVGSSPDSHGLSPLDAMRVAQNQQKAASRQKERNILAGSNHKGSADSYGLSPLDAMRVAQNQQKAASRQKERETLQQYSRHSDHGSTTSPAASNDGSKRSGEGIPPPPSSSSSPESNYAVEEEDVTSPGKEMFVPSSSVTKQSLAKRKEEELEAIRKQRRESFGSSAAEDQLSNSRSKKYFVANDSSAETRRASIQKEKENELAALRGKGFAKSWKPSASSSATNDNVLKKSSSFCNMDTEKKVLRKSGLIENKASSLRTIPKLEKKQSSKELEELRGLGLAKSLKNQFTDAALENEKKDEAHLEQVRDLEERKAKTSEFNVSRNAPILSVADENALSVSKWKKEDRAKNHEALGYHRDYKGIETTQPTEDEENKEWKTTGKVHTTVRKELTTKEWEAPDQEKMEAAKPPDFSSNKKTKKPADPSGETGVLCESCGCILM